MQNYIGIKIRDTRKARNMTQEELGAKIGVNKAAINKYETGVVVNLKRTVIEKLAFALGVSPTYLMGWDDSQNVNIDSVQANNGIIGQANAPVTINGGTPIQLTKEETELLRIYRELGVKSRMLLLTTAMDLESVEQIK